MVSIEQTHKHSKHHLFQEVINENNISVCLNCEHKMECCPSANTGRTINLSFDCLPHIDTDDPPGSSDHDPSTACGTYDKTFEV